jgi:UBX domain-containing protein 1/4
LRKLAQRWHFKSQEIVSSSGLPCLSLSNNLLVNGAIEWLEANQDKTWEEIQEENTKDSTAEPPPLNPGEQARSLKCDDCGKLFRSEAQAQFHAEKTEHQNFSESTEEIKPLTEEEKKAKLEELRERLAAKRANQAIEDKETKRKNEEIRRKATKESQDIKEELQKKERLKEAQAKRREKQEDIDARKRVQEKIEADKRARKEKAEREKALREGRAEPAVVTAASLPQASKSSASSSASEARLRLQTPNGSISKTFPAETTLFEVAHSVKEETGMEVKSFMTNFPKKTFDQTDFGQTLKEAGMTPSAALIVR